MSIPYKQSLPQCLGCYEVEYAKGCDYSGRSTGILPATKFEWYLKNHIGSTMLVYGTSAYDDSYFSSYKGGVKAAYDYRAFGEQVTLSEPTDKVTENFTGKEKDDETELNYFGARYLDPMLGMWISVDPARQYDSPYTYADNNPIIVTNPDGNIGVVGAVVGVVTGYAQANAISQITGKPVDYTVADLICDAAFGAAGLSFLKQGKKVVGAAMAAMNTDFSDSHND